MLVKNSSIITLQYAALFVAGLFIYCCDDFDFHTFVSGIIIGASFAALAMYYGTLYVAKKTLTEEERKRLGIGQKTEIKLR